MIDRHGAKGLGLRVPDRELGFWLTIGAIAFFDIYSLCLRAVIERVT